MVALREQASRLPSAVARSVEDRTTPEGLANFLGWFSVGLGLAEVVAPRSLGRLIGVDTSPALLRAFGLREIASGVGILAGRDPGGWLWSRVAGDAMDLAVLGSNVVRAGDDGRRSRVLAATLAVAGVTALDVICAREHTDPTA